MKIRFAKFLLLFIILLGGHGNVNAQISRFSHPQLNFIVTVKENSGSDHYLDRGRFFESFKRKACLLDNEETEENFTSIQKQLVKSTYFLNFLCSNKLTEYTVAFTKKINYRNFFSLFSNKVYVLFQVFRI